MKEPLGFAGMAFGRHIRTRDGRVFRRHHKDSNKYPLPHQGARECARRVRQGVQHNIKRFLVA